MVLSFEYDPAKSEANQEKHGIDFMVAQALWADDDLVTFPAKERGEERWAALGKMAGKHWVAFYTLRDANIRLISVRRARAGEVNYYESQRTRQNF